MVAAPAEAQVTTRLPILCFPDRDAVVERMRETHGEVLVNQGIAARGWIVEVLVNPTDGDFTILLTSPNGSSCMMATGTDWQDVPHVTPGRAS